MDLATAMLGGAFEVGKNTFHMGINNLLPLSGHVASVSPIAVRLHAHGGLQLADQALEGMLCGTVHPDLAADHQTRDVVVSHITVGGILQQQYGTHANCDERYFQNPYQLHCLDIWRGLHVVSSRKLRDSKNDPSLGITALATSHTRGSVVAGCSDGKIRLFDGSLREIANIRGHTSCVNDVTVSNDGMLIASTGCGYRPAGSAFLYTFPDPNVLIFDIRFLGMCIG